ncbi:MAG: hypothetical protein JWQ07_1544 [Ramlibacter sp.]|nr:hypothetical protein [Ramlibacter sp.]
MPKGFQLPAELKYNRALIGDARAYFSLSGCASWLFIVGDEFASMQGGMSYAQVRQAAPHSARVVSDPPRVLDLALARQHVEALDSLPRPTLVSCRTGPRASAVAYMYAGLKSGANPDDVIAAAESEGAPFCKFPEYKDWVRAAMEALRGSVGGELS